MGKRALIRRLDRLIEANDQRIDRAVIAGKPTRRMLAELALLREVRVALELRPQITKPGPKAPITMGQRPRTNRELQKTEALIVEYMEAYPGHEFALCDLLSTLKMPEKTLKNCLMRLVRDGFIARPRRGFYATVKRRTHD